MQKIAKPSLVMDAVLAVVDTFVHLGKGDNTDTHSRREKRFEQVGSRFIPFEVVSNIIRVYQVCHRFTSGRVESLRLVEISALNFSTSISFQLPAALRKA